MKKTYLIFLILFPVGIFAQSFPVAVDDSAQVMNQKLLEVNSLLNDYDPDGDTIEIIDVWGGSHDDDHWFEDSIVYYISEWHEGWDYLRYKVAKVNNPSMESERAYIRIEVLHNPDVPVALDDTLSAKYLEPTPFYIMANDFDPNGDEIIIHDIGTTARCSVEISPDSSHVIFTSEYNPNNWSVYFTYEIIEKSTDEKYYSDRVVAGVTLEENEDLPIAVNDSFEATGGILAIFDILANDHDPMGDTLEYFELTNPSHGNISIDGNLILYTAGTSYTGPDEFEYAIRYKNNPGLYSEVAEVKIQVNKNPDCPVGVPDFASGMAFTDVAVDVLSNDYDPNGDSIEIMDATTRWPSLLNISFSGDSITYMPVILNTRVDTAFYRIRKTNSPGYYSEWIPIYFEVLDNPDFPITQPDSVISVGRWETTINFRKNDYIPDSMEFNKVFFTTKQGLGETYSGTDSTVKYFPFGFNEGRDTIIYSYMNYSYPFYILAQGEIYVDVINNRSYDSLYINNINAGVNSNLTLFSKCKESHEGWLYQYDQHFNVPKSSKKSTIYLNKIWIGGFSESGELHLAGQRYGQRGRDYRPGPISDNYDSAFLVKWQRTWKIQKSEINYHVNNWWKNDYEPVEVILNWPGNGDPAYNLPDQMAPYHDRNNDGIYDPFDGDYPIIRGDECIFFMANDDRQHTETGGDSLIVEIHCMVYAYEKPDDSILNNTIFVHYDLINRSQNTYYDTYFGVFTDLEIGYGWDDFVGSHVMGNSFYGYNGRDPDGSNEPEAYGIHPPAQSVTILAGPYMDADDQDNPSGGCDFSVNGLNFGNDVIDDERHGLSHFIDFRGGGLPQDHPQIAIEYYQYMTGFWINNTPVMFGGIGYQNFGSTAGPECRYMWPGDTDPFNWGTNCVLPNDGYNQNDKWWTEEQCNNYPDNRYGMGSCGPFTFHPGDVQEVDMAYVFANSYYNADSSKNLLIERLYELRQRVLDGEIIIPNDELNINDLKISQSSFNVYPNPARQMIYLVQDDFESSNMEYRIVNTMGTIMQSGKLSPKTPNEIKVSSLKPGLYIISVFTEEGLSMRKFIKY